MITDSPTTITMADGTAGLARLHAWLSPAFPVGAFAYSMGLETAIANGTVHNAETMADWLYASLTHGGVRTDALLLAAAHRAHSDPKALAEIAELALALAPAAERVAELTDMGQAFLTAAGAWPTPGQTPLPSPCPYPVAVGATSGAHALPLADVLTVFLTATAQGQISVGLRLVPLGQTEGLKILAAAEPALLELAALAVRDGLDALGGIGYGADIAMMAHETLEPRIFRS